LTILKSDSITRLLLFFKILLSIVTFATSGQSLNVIADSEVDIEAGGWRAVHQVSDPAALPAEVLAGVELGAVVRMRNQIVLRIFGHLGADFTVS
jgi:hypothetical protein